MNQKAHSAIPRRTKISASRRPGERCSQVVKLARHRDELRMLGLTKSAEDMGTPDRGGGLLCQAKVVSRVARANHHRLASLIQMLERVHANGLEQSVACYAVRFTDLYERFGHEVCQELDDIG